MPKSHRTAARKAATVFAAALLLASAAAHAQWKWRDERGQIHVSDIPPPRTIPDKDVLQRPELVVNKPPPVAAAAAASAATAKVGADPALEEKKRLAEQEKAAREQAEQNKVAALRRDNCSRAREQMATLQSGVRIARVNANGEREIMSDQQRAAETQRARGLIASDCR